MARIAGVILLSVLPLLVLAAETPTALNAIEALPKEELKSLARIVAYDGTPGPERWHYLIHDPNAASGLREYVVANGELVAARGISQFAQRLTDTDVIGNYELQIDSDGLAKLANEYATANNLTISKFNYQLFKGVQMPEPQWQVNCLDETGKTIGTLVVSATQGRVVSHAGFPMEPAISDEQRSTWKRNSDPTSAKKRVATAAVAGGISAAASTQKKASADSGGRSTSKKRIVTNSQRGRRQAPVRVLQGPPPVMERRPSNPIGNFFRRVLRL